MAAILPQYNGILRPYTSVISDTAPTPNYSLTNNAILIGFVSDITKLKNITIATPTQIGFLTDINTAASICDTYGFQYTFTSSTTWDIATTDEIAGMLFNAALSYQVYQANNPTQEINPVQYTIGVLDPAQNARSNDLFVYINNITNVPVSGGYYLIPSIYASPTNFTFTDDIPQGGYFTVYNYSTAVSTISITGAQFAVTDSTSVTTVSIVPASKLTLLKMPDGRYMVSNGVNVPSTNEMTPYGTFFTQMLNEGYPCDTIAQPYQYIAGDSDSNVNYLSELKFFSTAVNNAGNPTLGRAISIVGNPSILNNNSVPDALAINNNKYSVTIIYSQPTNSSKYQLPMSWLCAYESAILCGMQPPFNGFAYVPLSSVPVPDPSVAGTTYSNDYIDTLNRYGYTTLIVNKATSTVLQSRILMSFFTNPVTNQPNPVLIDYQNFCISFYFNYVVYERLLASGIINQRFFVNKSGTSDVLAQAYDVVYGAALDFFAQKMIAVDPVVYSKEFMAYIKADNYSRIYAISILLPSYIIYQLQATTVIQDASSILGNQAIST